jgi:ATPase subunit of ABC transporter with duplicated ATPase domains
MHILYSHDRFFLDRVATHILSYEGDSKVVFFEGNYQEYDEYRRKTVGAPIIKAITYAPLLSL